MKQHPLWSRIQRSTAVLLMLVSTAPGCDQIGPPTQLAVLPEDRFPVWSPDGHSVAYFHEEKHDNATYDDPAYPTGLYVLDIESGTRQMVTKGYAITPDWSPDGARLAFAGGDLFTVSADGSDLRRVTSHGSAFFPRYAPDGATLSYGRSGTQQEVGLWFAHFSNSGALRLRRFGYGAPPADWSPNGTRIVFEGPQSAAPGGNQIWSADSSGSDRAQLTSNNFINRAPAWSANGLWIAWTVLKPGGTAAIWLMRADGSEPRQLLEDAQEPAWSPDSRQIVFSRGREGRGTLTLWTIRLDGSGLRPLTSASPSSK